MNTGIKIKINVNWWPMGLSKFQENHNTNMPVATRGKKYLGLYPRFYVKSMLANAQVIILFLLLFDGELCS